MNVVWFSLALVGVSVPLLALLVCAWQAGGDD